MTTYRLTRTFLYYWLAVTFLFYMGCDRADDVDDRLNLAESLMESRPDSALIILDGVEDSDLRNNKDKARHALLKSMALDKNYIDTTTFEVLQPAIDYYLNNGSSDEQLRTRYYESVIFRNSQKDDLAMHTLLKANDIRGEFTDSLTLARLYVALGSLYYKQYQISDFISNNVAAADIYGRLGISAKQLQCYGKAIIGEIILGNEMAADSLWEISNLIVKSNPSLSPQLINQRIRLTVEFGSVDSIRESIELLLKHGDPNNMQITLAKAHSKIGESGKALGYLNEAKVASDNILDSLTYWSVKTEILEKLGREKDALECHRNYTRLLEDYHMQLFSNELLFSEKKHEMEMENMAKIQKRDRMIKWISVGAALLLIITLLTYYRYLLNKTGRLLAERNAENLKLETDKQRLLAENLESERDRLELANENLQLRMDELERESDQLKVLLESQNTLSDDARQLIRERIELLNGLIAQALTEQDSYGKQFNSYIAKVKKDKKGFQESLVKVLSTTHPGFIAELKAHGLTERELHYCCLYAIGLRGKEIGSYLDLVRHYNISTEVRRKLGLDPNDRNLGPFLRNLLAKHK